MLEAGVLAETAVQAHDHRCVPGAAIALARRELSPRSLWGDLEPDLLAIRTWQDDRLGTPGHRVAPELIEALRRAGAQV